MKRKLGIAEVEKREQVIAVKVDGIMKNGEDNAYPTRMERIRSASITASAASNMMARFLIGDGFVNPDLNTIVVGNDGYRDITAYKLLSQIAKSISRQNGVFVRAGFNGLGQVAGLKHVDYSYCRFSVIDDLNKSGKVVIYDNWDKSKSRIIKKSDYVKVDVWNPTKEVIQNQIKVAGSIEKYKGQMFYEMFDDDYIYPLAPLDPVQFDADSEDQVAKFKNGELRRGFFLKYILTHTEFESQEEAEDFLEKVQGFMGGDHTNSVFITEGTFNDDGTINKTENINIEKLEQNINDKLFEAYEKSWANNIRKAYDAIPQILIDYEVSQLGSTSGEAIVQAANFYNMQTEQKRTVIENIFKTLFANWVDAKYRNIDWTIKALDFGSTVDNSGTAND